MNSLITRRIARASVRRLIGIMLFASVAGAARADAQSFAGIGVGLSGGGTYYCIETRCNTGSTLGLFVDVPVASFVAVEAAVRRHFCFDCDRFVLADGAVVFRSPARTVRPFGAAGVSRSADHGSLGAHTGLLAAVGAWVQVQPWLDTKLELRGRQLGQRNAMGELSLSMAYRFSN